MKKTIQKLLLSTSFILSLATPVHAYSDVKTGAWYYEVVTDMSNRGYMSGKSADIFDPDANVTAGEFATMLATAFYPDTLEAEKAKQSQSDPWWTPYANTLEAHKNSATTGTSLNNVNYEAPITRSVVTVFVEYLFANQEVPLPSILDKAALIQPFTDVTAATYGSCIGTTVYFNIMGGVSDTSFQPNSSLTRAQAAVIIRNLVESPYLTEGGTGTGVGTHLGNTDVKTIGSTSYYNTYYGNQKTQVLLNHGSSFTLVEGTTSPILATTYDLDGNVLRSKTLSKDLSLFGGFYQGDDYYYAVFGETNPNSIDSKEVFRIVKYDQNFNVLDSLSIPGSACYTQTPFRSGSCVMAEENGVLVVHTSRLRYDGHQSQVTFHIDTQHMELKYNVGQYQGNHVSHSFNQFVAFDQGHLTLLDHGDAYPRALVIQKGTSNATSVSYTEQNILTYPGETGQNYTGVSVGGFGIGNSHYLVSISRALSESSSAYRDAYLLVQSKTGGTTKEIQLNSFGGKTYCSTPPLMVDLESNYFMLLWEEMEVSSQSAQGTYYQIFDENGNSVVGKTLLSQVRLSSTQQPILMGSQVLWTVDDGTNRTLHTIDVPSQYLSSGSNNSNSSAPNTSTPNTSTPDSNSNSTTPDSNSNSTTPDTSTPNTSTPDSNSNGSNSTVVAPPGGYIEENYTQSVKIRVKEEDIVEDGDYWIMNCSIFETGTIPNSTIQNLNVGSSLTLDYHQQNGASGFSSTRKTFQVSELKYNSTGNGLTINASTDNIFLVKVGDVWVISRVNGDTNYTLEYVGTGVTRVAKTALTRNTLTNIFSGLSSSQPYAELILTLSDKSVKYVSQNLWPVN